MVSKVARSRTGNINYYLSRQLYMMWNSSLSSQVISVDVLSGSKLISVRGSKIAKLTDLWCSTVVFNIFSLDGTISTKFCQ